jgi:NADH-quinone oxidoreductase subunit N
MEFFKFQDLQIIIPELQLAFFGMLLLIADLVIPEKKTIASFALIGIVGSAVSLLRMQGYGESVKFAYGETLILDQFAWFFKLLFLIAAAISILLSMRYLDVERENHGEYYSLILFATMGMMFMASAVDLVTLYIGLETMAIATYILVGFLRGNQRSNEASLKYFLLGAFSSAILLYGFSLLYGLAGSTNFAAISAALSQPPEDNPLKMLAVVAVLAGLFFKIAAVPFHQWTPDAYEGAPTSITAFMSVAVKAASFAMMWRVLIVALIPMRADWTPILTVICVLTMTLGNIAAIAQSNVKRLLAYSSISHAGYVLIGFIAGVTGPGGGPNTTGMVSIPLYLMVYTFTNLGVWAVVVALRRKNIIGERIDDMNGLFFRNPASAILMLIFLLSLAGIPPTAGFVAKYYLFAAAIETHHNTLAVIAVLNAAVSVFVYLRIVVAMFMRDATETTGMDLSGGVRVALVVAFLFTLGLGLYPEPIIGLARWASPY